MSESYKGNPLLKPSNVPVAYTQEQIDEYKKCMVDPIYFMKNYIKIVNVDKGLVNFKLYDFQEEIVDIIQNNRFSIFKLPRQVGKAEYIENFVPTPNNGFVKIKDLKIGDEIFSPNGSPIKIIDKSPVWKNHDCYKVYFDNNESIIVNKEHLWEVYSSNWVKNNGKKILNTVDLSSYVNKKSSSGRPYILLPNPVDYTSKKLPIDPYILGLWLGDGDSRSGVITSHKNDYHEYKNILQSIETESISKIYEYDKTPNITRFKITNLTERLTKYNLKRNKHIPQCYMESSINDRIALIRGLMDTDGSSKSKQRSYQFYQKSIDFCEQFRVLLASLGIKSRLTSKLINGVLYHTVRFSCDFIPFALPRKIRHTKNSRPRPQEKRLYVTKIEKVESVDTQCITVDSEDHLYLTSKYYIPTHNSVTVGMWTLHYTNFNPNKKVAILANKLSTAKEILDRLKRGFENLPKWLQQGVVEWNKTSVTFENGSKIVVAATSSSAVRGDSYNMIILDEFAFIHQNMAEEFFTSVYPTISSGHTTKMCVISTPKGMNHFYKMWTDAKEGRSEYIPFEIHWSRVPGRDEEWKNKQIANTSELQFQQEFECHFLGSQNTLISGVKLRTLAHKRPILEIDEGFNIYEEPKEGNTYCMVVDVSHGAGLDYSAFSIINVSEFPYKQVAVFKNHDVPPLAYPNYIHPIAKKYNNAYILIELNDTGNQVADLLYTEYEYDNLIVVSQRGRKGQVADSGFGGKNSQKGIKTSKSTKRIGCSILKTLIEEDKLLLQDHETIFELSTFVSSKGSYEAEPGHHDDIVMGLVNFAWLTTQPLFKDLTNSDTRQKIYEEKLKQIEEYLTPSGFFLNNSVDDKDKTFKDADGQVWSVVDDDMSGFGGFF